MNMGLPLAAWALLVVSVGLGLGLELAFIRARRRAREVGSPGRGASAKTATPESGRSQDSPGTPEAQT